MTLHASARFALKPIALGASLLAVSAFLAACGGSDDDKVIHPSGLTEQPVIHARAKAALTVDGKQFKDLNANGKLDPYEDWRLSVDDRINDLVSQMTDTEKVGMMMINDNNAGCAGAVTSTAVDYINNQKMTRFILRSTATATADPCDGSVTPGRGGYKVTPQQLAAYTNALQEMAENTRLGIPLVFKDNARNHVETDPRQGIGAGAGAFSQFPKEAGLAAAALGEQFLKEGKTTTGDMSVIRTFTEVMGPEYNAVGLRAAYTYMADLLTEPRWYRAHEVFTEDADLNANIMKTLVQGLQGSTLRDGTSVSPTTHVALTMKHFPGGGPQELGMDPHYSFGKYQQYSDEAGFAYNMKPFEAAIAAGVSSIMPYYGVPMTGRDGSKNPKALTYDGVTYPLTGFAFSKSIVTDLLRDKLGFKGYVNSDTGIIKTMAWGMEDKSISERIAAAINGGTDTLSGFAENAPIKALVDQGLITKERLNQAAKSLLKEQFQLGLFENPYVEASKASSVIGTDASRAIGLEMQKKSVVLLKNEAPDGSSSKVLPIKAGAKVYTIGFGKADVEKYGYTVTDGNYSSGSRTTSASGHDVAVIRVLVKDVAKPYHSKSADYGDNPLYLNPLTGKTWGAEDPCRMYPAPAYPDNAKCADGDTYGGTIFGGALPWEIGDISFTGMAAATSRTMYPTLADIKAIMAEIGDPKKVVLSVYFRAPYVMDDASGLKNAGAILATFGVTDLAMMEVLSGKFKPQGKMPFALPNSLAAVQEQKSDYPGFDETQKPNGADGALVLQGQRVKFGYGLTY